MDELSTDQTDYTVLAEFSSVVADTQQYIVPGGEEQETREQDTGQVYSFKSFTVGFINFWH